MSLLDERISLQEKALAHWQERKAEARDGQEEAMCRGWIASVTRVLEKLRKQQAEAARVAS